MDTHYSEHVALRQRHVERALADLGYERLVISSGKPFTYFADDMDAPMRSTPHFAHWLPLEGPHHLLVVEAGKRPQLVRVAPEDYWYEQAPLGAPFWAAEFQLREVKSAEAAWKSLSGGRRTAYLGDQAELALAQGVAPDDVQPKDLLARLDWERASKSEYELECLRAAQRSGVRGHRAALEAFLSGSSELEVHQAYVRAAGSPERDLPYGTIVALDEKGAILHYEGKRSTRHGQVLLIDAGTRQSGYASDITRTWTAPTCDKLFVELVAGMERLQQELCEVVRPGLSYLDLHLLAHRKIADLLHCEGLLKRGGEEAVALGLTRPFFPHGLGHFLGIQVHDVGGRQATREGGLKAPPAEHPYLRTTRRIEAGQVFTIEPGLYFIELLLRPLHSSKLAEHVDWKLVERLSPRGGIRIEDDVLVTPNGIENLTRRAFAAA